MHSKYFTIERSLGARQIQAYCRALCKELGLQMVEAWWTSVLNPPRQGAPHHLVVQTTGGDRECWFTAEEIAGYPTQETTASVQTTIRAEIVDLLADLEEPPAKIR
jgi:hypothetical protein